MALTEQEKERRSIYLSEHLKITTKVDQKDYVFVSYKSDDWEVVFKDIVIPLQEKYGLRVYCDANFENVNNFWLKAMEENMVTQYCRGVIAFFSKGYYTSYATLIELLTSKYMRHEKPVVPVILGDTNAMERYFETDEAYETDSGLKGSGDERKSFVKLMNSFCKSISKSKNTELIDALEDLRVAGEAPVLTHADIYKYMKALKVEINANNDNSWNNPDYPDHKLKSLHSTIRDAVQKAKKKGEVDFDVFDVTTETQGSKPTGVTPAPVASAPVAAAPVATPIAAPIAAPAAPIAAPVVAPVVSTVVTQVNPGWLKDDLSRFKKNFSKLSTYNAEAHKKSQAPGNAPAIAITFKINFCHSCFNNVTIEGDKWKSAFVSMLENFYAIEGSTYYDYVVKKFDKGSKMPLVVTNEHYNTVIAPESRKRYSEIADGAYYVFNSYSAQLLIDAFEKHIAMYCTYQCDVRGQQVSVDQVSVEYLLSNPNLYSAMTEIRGGTQA